MLPPRDYPEFKPSDVAGQKQQDNELVTLRSVLDRSDSDKPVTDAMIQTAVSNLYSAGTKDEHPPRSPKALRSILKNVRRD